MNILCSEKPEVIQSVVRRCRCCQEEDLQAINASNSDALRACRSVPLGRRKPRAFRSCIVNSRLSSALSSRSRESTTQTVHTLVFYLSFSPKNGPIWSHSVSGVMFGRVGTVYTTGKWPLCVFEDHVFRILCVAFDLQNWQFIVFVTVKFQYTEECRTDMYPPNGPT